ncbi:MAG: roadblock/LC7 domain-containing protein [Candidatus Lokiarchaeota archaeon]|nr:roadblock/LC7 domain-containing protein [Candidatus Lokiarchaeota archaeon]
MSENIAELTDLLRQMEAVNPNIQGSAIVSVQGLPICSALARDVNDGIVSAMSAAILSVSERAVEELARGDLKRILIEGVDGIIILSKAGENAILCTLARSDASLGMVFLNIQSVSNKIAELLD